MLPVVGVKNDTLDTETSVEVTSDTKDELGEGMIEDEKVMSQKGKEPPLPRSDPEPSRPSNNPVVFANAV